jgi:hypothetical protein
MIKSIFFIPVFLFFLNCNAQRVMHSVGASVNLITEKVNIPARYGGVASTKIETLFHGSGDYFFRYNLTETEKSSISIGVPVSIGLGSANDPNNDAAGLYFATDISLGAFYNSGLKSTKENENNFGYFVGGGISYGYIGLYYDKQTFKISTYGPMVYSGVRFPIKNEVLSVGLFFRYGLEKEKLKTYGLKLMKDF